MLTHAARAAASQRVTALVRFDLTKALVVGSLSAKQLILP